MTYSRCLKGSTPLICMLVTISYNKTQLNLCKYKITGLLDIYGFESFQVNSLEQLCINYANERLQLYFVQHYLKDIQAEYLEEGVAWEEIFLCSDNESCVQLMSGSPSIFSLLDEVITPKHASYCSL